MPVVLRLVAALLAVAVLGGAAPRAREVPRDPANPTCPAQPNWTEIREMQLTPLTRNGVRILLAEGAIDAGMPARLRALLESDQAIEEVWLRSPGGVARAGNEAGRIIRNLGLTTRIPSGWTCFSACNFMFMGGVGRTIEPGAVFMVHMFTFTNEAGAIRYATEQGTEATIQLVGDIEQESALLATEDNDFLLRMGVSRLLLTEVMYQQRAVASGSAPAQRYCLTLEEATRYNVHAPPQIEE
jgi:hypothetical protein